MKSQSLRYSLLTYRHDQLWLPAAFWALFAVMTLILGQDRGYDIARGLIGGVLPLLAGIMAAYAVLDDPALELQFATPVPAYKTLVQRLGLTFVIIAMTALTFQLFLRVLGIDLARSVDMLTFQLTWTVPTLLFLALGSAAAFAFGSTSGGAMIAGLVWLMELLLRDGLIADATLRYIAVFMALVAPTHPDLRANALVLAALAVLLLVAGWMLFKKQERYL